MALYISSRKAGVWQAVKNIGDAINSTSIDYCPFVSFDNKHFFFTSKKNGIHLSHPTRLNAKTVHQLLSTAGNGTDDIYWMDFSRIKMLLQE